MKTTLLVVLFMHFVVVNANTYYYQKTLNTDCKTRHASAIGSPRAFSGCSDACDANSNCGAFQTYQEGFTVRCQLLSLPADFDKSECITGQTGWHFYERIHDCPYYVLPDPASAGKVCPVGDTIETESECQAFYDLKLVDQSNGLWRSLDTDTTSGAPYGCSLTEGTFGFTVTYNADSSQGSGTSSSSYSVCKDTEGCSATSGGNCFLYYRQADVLTAATEGSGNQYCVMPGEEGSILKCSDHYGFGTRHCDCEADENTLKNLICGRCDTEMENTCKKHVGYCRQQHCTETYGATDHEIAAQQWSLTECLYTKYTCIEDQTLTGYALDVDHRRICPGYKTKQWDNSQTAFIADPADGVDTCEEATKDPDNSLTQSAWWAVPRPYKVIEGKGCQNGDGNNKISGTASDYLGQLYGSEYYAALPGCAKACDLDNTCDGFRLATSDHSSPGACMKFRAASNADDFETLVNDHCDNADEDMYIKTETSPSPPPPPAAVSPPPPTSSCKGSGSACLLDVECCDGSCDFSEFGGGAC